MIKFFCYNKKYRSPLKILIPPFNVEDFEKSTFSPSAPLYGGLIKARVGNEVKLIYRTIHQSSINLYDESDFPKRSVPGHSSILWFTSRDDVKRFLQENRDIILDLSQGNELVKMKPVTEKWSYYILKYRNS